MQGPKDSLSFVFVSFIATFKNFFLTPGGIMLKITQSLSKLMTHKCWVGFIIYSETSTYDNAFKPVSLQISALLWYRIILVSDDICSWNLHLSQTQISLRNCLLNYSCDPPIGFSFHYTQSKNTSSFMALRAGLLLVTKMLTVPVAVYPRAVWTVRQGLLRAPWSQIYPVNTKTWHTPLTLIWERVVAKGFNMVLSILRSHKT